MLLSTICTQTTLDLVLKGLSVGEKAKMHVIVNFPTYVPKGLFLADFLLGGQKIRDKEKIP